MEFREHTNFEINHVMRL